MLKKILRYMLVAVMIFSTLFVFQMNKGFGAEDLKIGAWLGTQPSESGIREFSQLQNRKLDIVHMFINWSTNFDFVRTHADPVYSNGSILMITWEPWEYDTVKIKNGNADSYIRRMASDIKSYGKEIWLRPLHEANGNWYPWGIGDSDVNTNDTYIAAYRRIVDIFRSTGTTNVKWVFNTNCDNVGTNATFTGNYPGDEYVDFTSIDGYNWGTTQSWGSTWKSFDEIFASSYDALKPYNKPIIIGEWASTEIGGDKAKWITESFNTIRTSYDMIYAVVWFNQNKETDWRINSSEAALNAYKSEISTEIVSPTPTRTVPPSPTATTVNYVVGDFNNDGSFNSIDFGLTRMYLLGLQTNIQLDADWVLRTDVDATGSVNSMDFAYMRMRLLGMIAKFPAEK